MMADGVTPRPPRKLCPVRSRGPHEKLLCWGEECGMWPSCRGDEIREEDDDVWVHEEKEPLARLIVVGDANDVAVIAGFLKELYGE